MTAGASKAAPTTIQQPALAPSPPPRPAPTGRALPLGLAAQGGQNWTPIRGHIWGPIDSYNGAAADGWRADEPQRDLSIHFDFPRRENRFYLYRLTDTFISPRMPSI